MPDGKRYRIETTAEMSGTATTDTEINPRNNFPRQKNMIPISGGSHMTRCQSVESIPKRVSINGNLL
jgi:hypothetical protein